MSLEFGHFQPEFWLSASFICLILQWPPNGLSLLGLLLMLPPGLSYKKVYLIMSFSCWETFTVPFLLSCSLFGLNPFPGPFFFFPSSRQTWHSSSNEYFTNPPKCMTVPLKMYAFSLPLSKKLLSHISNFASSKKFSIYVNVSPWYI